MKKICVIGSLNMDLVSTMVSFPKPGETIFGDRFNTFPGGKGANQAVALGKLGSDVTMIGKIGNDMYGTEFLDVLVNNNVNFEGIGIENDVSSGVALIQVNDKGENNIVVISGANGKVDIDYIENKWEIIEKADIFLFQLEIPLETVIYTMKKLRRLKKTIILDPAPASKLPDEIFEFIDYITPNEIELETLTEKKIDCEKDLREAAQVLLEKGVKVIISKQGSNGAAIIKSDKLISISGFKVNAVDTTAAGDSFNAGFAFALAEEKSLEECVRFANAVGAISTTALGAQQAMPDYKTVSNFILKNK